MTTRLFSLAAAAGLVTAILTGFGSAAQATPLAAGAAALQGSAPTHIVNAQYRRWGGRAFGPGRAWGRPYYRWGGGYPGRYWPYYAGAAGAAVVLGAPYYAPPPAYYAPPPGRQCWIETDRDRQFGYWGYC